MGCVIVMRYVVVSRKPTDTYRIAKNVVRLKV